jgi:hypothetical protein
MPFQSLDRADAELAVALASPSIERALADSAVSGLGVLHLVIIDPTARPGERPFDSAVLHEASIGDRSRWDVDYAAYARDKARTAWRHAMDTRRLATLEPQRLGSDDSPLAGGICFEGLVVAASGAMPQWDEAFALMVAGVLRALARSRVSPS